MADMSNSTTAPPQTAATAERDTGAPVVSVRGLHKTFKRADGTLVHAVDGVDLDVFAGEFVVLLGPSGCGKTTLLRSIAGLELPRDGSIKIHGKDVFDGSRALNVPPQKRRISMIFQSYALWPHMTAFENVAYPLRARKTDRSEIDERVHRALTLVGIPELVKQHPANMSGGQQQRVALARSLVAGDGLVLFDEPLSNVDAKVREQLRVELLSMQRDLGFSALYVTHDQVEAMELANRIAVMRTGKIEQLGSPREVYEEPRTRYVANFIGSANELGGTIQSELGDGMVLVETELGPMTVTLGSQQIGVGDDVAVVCRPERLQVVDPGHPGPNAWAGHVTASMFVGSHTEHVVAVNGVSFRLWRADARLFEAEQAVHVAVDPRDVRAVRLTDA